MTDPPSQEANERVLKALDDAVRAATEALETAGVDLKMVSVISYLDVDEDYEAVMSQFPTEEILLSYSDPLKVIVAVAHHPEIMQQRLVRLVGSLVNVDGRMN